MNEDDHLIDQMERLPVESRMVEQVANQMEEMGIYSVGRLGEPKEVKTNKLWSKSGMRSQMNDDGANREPNNRGFGDQSRQGY